MVIRKKTYSEAKVDHFGQNRTPTVLVRKTDILVSDNLGTTPVLMIRRKSKANQKDLVFGSPLLAQFVLFELSVDT